jgi:hypothetical protein
VEARVQALLEAADNNPHRKLDQVTYKITKFAEIEKGLWN